MDNNIFVVKNSYLKTFIYSQMCATVNVPDGYIF